MTPKNPPSELKAGDLVAHKTALDKAWVAVGVENRRVTIERVLPGDGIGQATVGMESLVPYDGAFGLFDALIAALGQHADLVTALKGIHDDYLDRTEGSDDDDGATEIEPGGE
jgi:hypothetical protein